MFAAENINQFFPLVMDWNVESNDERIHVIT